MPDTTVREGWFRETYAGRQWMASDKMAASKQSVRVRCVVVTGRTAQDVERLLREPTDEDIARAARAMHDNWPAYNNWPAYWPAYNSGPDVESFEDFVERFAALAIATYRSPEEADRA